jgi:hypothetical protein
MSSGCLATGELGSLPDGFPTIKKQEQRHRLDGYRNIFEQLANNDISLYQSLFQKPDSETG